MDEAFPLDMPRAWCVDRNADIGTDARQSGNLVLERTLYDQHRFEYGKQSERLTASSTLCEEVDLKDRFVADRGPESTGGCRSRILHGAARVDFIVGHKSVERAAMFCASQSIRYRGKVAYTYIRRNLERHAGSESPLG